VRETGSTTVRKLLREPAATSRLSEVEIASALARLAREGVISAAERERGLEALTDDFQSLWIVEITPDVISLARTLLVRHVMRAADAIQLASCLYIRREVSDTTPLVAFDDRLTDAAAEQNVPVIPSQRTTT
jgi:predicted nucleic acid-binding protein